MANLPKFRAWHKEKKWMGKVTMLNIAIGRLVMVGMPGTKHETIAENCSFDHVPLMQWTGLQDKNGKDVYIGDLIKLAGEESNDYLLKVVALEDQLGFALIWLRGDRPLNLAYTLYKFEVVGNIYENNNLLEQK